MARRSIPTTRSSPARRRSSTKTSARPYDATLAAALIADGDRATSYCVEVLESRIIAGPHVRNACRRHLDDLVHGPARGLVWHLEGAKYVWDWWERMLKLSEGQFEGTPFLLDPSQAFRIGALFGWKWTTDLELLIALGLEEPSKKAGMRRFRRFYDEEGKGNGKSPLAGGIGLYLLTADGEAGAQVYAAGAKKDQAKILFADAVKMVKKSPKLMKRLRFSGGEGNEYNIAYLLGGGSFFRPISKDSGRKGSGPRPHGALADELHEHPDGTTIEMLERGFKFRRQPLLVMLTNSGSDRKSVCWEEHQHAVRVAAGTRTPDAAFSYVGEVIDDATFSYVCALDEGDDPLTDPSCWGKTNPLLGVILNRDDLAAIVRQAKDLPGKRNGILRLHFCVWTDSDQAWISRETLERVLAEFDPAVHADKKTSLGLDLSGTRDLTALASVVQTGTVTRERDDGTPIELPTFDAWVEAWTPKDTLAARAQRDQAPYQVWVDEGHLRATPGERVRYDYVAQEVARLEERHGVRVLAYDRYAWEKFADELRDLGLQLLEVSHPQGGKKKAKPSEEQLAWAKAKKLPPPDGLWMPGSLDALETLIVDRRIRLRMSPVLISACMSAAIDSDPIGNRWLDKSKATQRIDPVIALCMAVGAALAPGLERVASVYESRGVRFV